MRINSAVFYCILLSISLPFFFYQKPIVIVIFSYSPVKEPDLKENTEAEGGGAGWLRSPKIRTILTCKYFLIGLQWRSFNQPLEADLFEIDQVDALVGAENPIVFFPCKYGLILLNKRYT